MPACVRVFQASLRIDTITLIPAIGKTLPRQLRNGGVFA
jgi:hypothetical protein